MRQAAEGLDKALLGACATAHAEHGGSGTTSHWRSPPQRRHERAQVTARARSDACPRKRARSINARLHDARVGAPKAGGLRVSRRPSRGRSVQAASA